MKEKKRDSGSISKTICAIFLNAKKDGLFMERGIKGIRAEHPNWSYSAIYSALWSLQQRGIIQKGKGRGYFYLINEEKARDYIGAPRNLFDLQGITTTPLPKGVKEFFEQFLDTDLAFLEKFEVTGVVLKHFQFAPLRAYLSRLAAEKDIRVKVSGRKERSQRVSFTVESMSLTLSLHGKLGLWIRSAEWIRDFTDLLEKAGIRDVAKVDVFQAVVARLPKSHASVEMPIRVPRDELPREFKVETRVGDKDLISRICGSHFPAELEVSGNWDMVQGFLSALAASQHFSAMQAMQTDSLKKIESVFTSPMLSMALQKVMEALSGLANAIDTLNMRVAGQDQAAEEARQAQQAAETQAKPNRRWDSTLC